MRDLLSSPQLKQLASRVGCLPSVPALYVELTDELRKEEPSLQRVVGIISKDLGMATKILQLVNSAFFGLPQRIENIMDAVTDLGLATIGPLVLSTQLFTQFEQRLIREFSISEFAGHCWMTGIFSRKIAEAERCDTKTLDQCLLSGLLHDAGSLILASGLPGQYSRVLRTARESSRSVWESECAEYGATHAEVGAYLLGLWGLPAPIVEAVALHHRPGAASGRQFSPVIAVHVANVLARRLSPSPGDASGPPLDMACLAKLGLHTRFAEWKGRCLGEHAPLPART
jgi:HD-like signal output (HDOD) protein